MLNNAHLLKPLATLRTDELVVTTMATVRPWSKYTHSPLDFASADSAMGHTADLALGLAMAQPHRKVLCLNGDGSMLMTLGTLATIIASGVDNLILFVLANGTYEITGNQPVPAAAKLDWCAMAAAAGFARTYLLHEPASTEEQLREILHGPGPVFVCVEVEPGSEGPISRSERETAPYLQTSLADWAHQLRTALMEPPPPDPSNR